LLKKAEDVITEFSSIASMDESRKMENVNLK